MGDSYSSGGKRGSGRPNQGRSGGGNRNRNNNRNRNRSKGGGRGGDGDREWKPSGNRGPRKPEPKPTFFQKILGFFGLGKKKKPQTTGKKRPTDRKDRPQRPDRPKREPLEVTSARLFVGNIDYNGTEEQLAEHFAQIGEVKSAEIVMNPHNGKPKGFAFVEMADMELAKKAAAELHDKEFLTRKLLVSGAKSDGAKKGGGPRNERRDGDRGGRGGNRNERSSSRDGGGRGGRERKGGGGRERREHSDSKEPAMKPIDIEIVTGPGLRLENLSADFSDQELKELFDGVGTIEDSHIDTDFALVQMASTEDAQKAVELLHAKDFMGKRLKVIGVELEKAEEAAADESAA